MLTRRVLLLEKLHAMENRLDEMVRRSRVRAARFQGVAAGALQLSPDQREELVVLIVDSLGVIDITPTKPEKKTEPLKLVVVDRLPKVRKHREGPTYADRAEAFVLAHPDGVVLEEIASAVGQEEARARDTLRFVCRHRRTIVKVAKGRWAPVAGAKVERPPSCRKAVLTVLSDGQPRATSEIYEIVVQVLPDVSRASVATEINRLKRDEVITIRGEGLHGPRYVIVDAGSGTATH